MSESLDPNSPGYTNALLEDINGKFEAVLEATQPIAKLQAGAVETNKRLSTLETKLDATFEEVGKLRVDVDALRTDIDALRREVGQLNNRLDVMEKAMKLLGRDSPEFKDLQNRMKVVERALELR